MRPLVLRLACVFVSLMMFNVTLANAQGIDDLIAALSEKAVDELEGKSVILYAGKGDYIDGHFQYLVAVKPWEEGESVEFTIATDYNWIETVEGDEPVTCSRGQRCTVSGEKYFIIHSDEGYLAIDSRDEDKVAALDIKYQDILTETTLGAELGVVEQAQEEEQDDQNSFRKALLKYLKYAGMALVPGVTIRARTEIKDLDPVLERYGQNNIIMSEHLFITDRGMRPDSYQGDRINVDGFTLTRTNKEVLLHQVGGDVKGYVMVVTDSANPDFDSANNWIALSSSQMQSMGITADSLGIFPVRDIGMRFTTCLTDVEAQVAPAVISETESTVAVASESVEGGNLPAAQEELSEMQQNVEAALETTRMEEAAASANQKMLLMRAGYSGAEADAIIRKIEGMKTGEILGNVFDYGFSNWGSEGIGNLMTFSALAGDNRKACIIKGEGATRIVDSGAKYMGYTVVDRWDTDNLVKVAKDAGIADTGSEFVGNIQHTSGAKGTKGTEYFIAKDKASMKAFLEAIHDVNSDLKATKMMTAEHALALGEAKGYPESVNVELARSALSSIKDEGALDVNIMNELKAGNVMLPEVYYYAEYMPSSVGKFDSLMGAAKRKGFWLAMGLEKGDATAYAAKVGQHMQKVYMELAPGFGVQARAFPDPRLRGVAALPTMEQQQAFVNKWVGRATSADATVKNVRGAIEKIGLENEALRDIMTSSEVEFARLDRLLRNIQQYDWFKEIAQDFKRVSADYSAGRISAQELAAELHDIQARLDALSSEIVPASAVIPAAPPSATVKTLKPEVEAAISSGNVVLFTVEIGGETKVLPIVNYGEEVATWHEFSLTAASTESQFGRFGEVPGYFYKDIDTGLAEMVTVYKLDTYDGSNVRFTIYPWEIEAPEYSKRARYVGVYHSHPPTNGRYSDFTGVDMVALKRLTQDAKDSLITYQTVGDPNHASVKHRYPGILSPGELRGQSYEFWFMAWEVGQPEPVVLYATPEQGRYLADTYGHLMYNTLKDAGFDIKRSQYAARKITDTAQIRSILLNNPGYTAITQGDAVVVPSIVESDLVLTPEVQAAIAKGAILKENRGEVVVITNPEKLAEIAARTMTIGPDGGPGEVPYYQVTDTETGLSRYVDYQCYEMGYDPESSRMVPYEGLAAWTKKNLKPTEIITGYYHTHPHTAAEAYDIKRVGFSCQDMVANHAWVMRHYTGLTNVRWYGVLVTNVEGETYVLDVNMNPEEIIRLERDLRKHAPFKPNDGLRDITGFDISKSEYAAEFITDPAEIENTLLQNPVYTVASRGDVAVSQGIETMAKQIEAARLAAESEGASLREVAPHLQETRHQVIEVKAVINGRIYGSRDSTDWKQNIERAERAHSHRIAPGPEAMEITEKSITLADGTIPTPEEAAVVTVDGAVVPASNPVQRARVALEVRGKQVSSMIDTSMSRISSALKRFFNPDRGGKYEVVGDSLEQLFALQKQVTAAEEWVGKQVRSYQNGETTRMQLNTDIAQIGTVFPSLKGLLHPGWEDVGEIGCGVAILLVAWGRATGRISEDMTGVLIVGLAIGMKFFDSFDWYGLMVYASAKAVAAFKAAWAAGASLGVSVGKAGGAFLGAIIGILPGLIFFMVVVMVAFLIIMYWICRMTQDAVNGPPDWCGSLCSLQDVRLRIETVPKPVRVAETCEFLHEIEGCTCKGVETEMEGESRVHGFEMGGEILYSCTSECGSKAGEHCDPDFPQNCYPKMSEGCDKWLVLKENEKVHFEVSGLTDKDCFGKAKIMTEDGGLIGPGAYCDAFGEDLIDEIEIELKEGGNDYGSMEVFNRLDIGLDVEDSSDDDAWLSITPLNPPGEEAAVWVEDGWFNLGRAEVTIPLSAGTYRLEADRAGLKSASMEVTVPEGVGGCRGTTYVTLEKGEYEVEAKVYETRERSSDRNIREVYLEDTSEVEITSTENQIELTVEEGAYVFVDIDDETIVAGNRGGVHRVADGEIVWSAGTDEVVRGVAVDGNDVYVASGGDVLRLDRLTGEVVFIYNILYTIFGLNADGEAIAVFTSSNNVLLFNRGGDRMPDLSRKALTSVNGISYNEGALAIGSENSVFRLKGENDVWKNTIDGFGVNVVSTQEPERDESMMTVAGTEDGILYAFGEPRDTEDEHYGHEVTPPRREEEPTDSEADASPSPQEEGGPLTSLISEYCSGAYCDGDFAYGSCSFTDECDTIICLEKNGKGYEYYLDVACDGTKCHYSTEYHCTETPLYGTVERCEEYGFSACGGGRCLFEKPTGKVLNCDDGDPCTEDSCNYWLGCRHENVC